MNSLRRKKKKKIAFKFAVLLIFVTIFLFSMYSLSDYAQYHQEQSSIDEEITKEKFIQQISSYAKELKEDYGILPSITIGQAILESNWGQSVLASEYKNLFGVKAYESQKKVSLETKEYINEEWIVIQGDFKVYDSWEESMYDHTQLFLNGVDWNPRLYENVVLATNYKEAAYALQEAGYATDPAYAQKVIDVIESHDLAKYDD